MGKKNNKRGKAANRSSSSQPPNPSTSASTSASASTSTVPAPAPAPATIPPSNLAPPPSNEPDESTPRANQTSYFDGNHGHEDSSSTLALTASPPKSSNGDLPPSDEDDQDADDDEDLPGSQRKPPNVRMETDMSASTMSMGHEGADVTYEVRKAHKAARARARAAQATSDAVDYFGTSPGQSSNGIGENRANSIKGGVERVKVIRRASIGEMPGYEEGSASAGRNGIVVPDPDVDFKRLRAPGGFRRFHLTVTGNTVAEGLLTFGQIFNNFGGENLTDLDGEGEGKGRGLDEAERAGPGRRDLPEAWLTGEIEDPRSWLSRGKSGERTPLLTRNRSMSRSRRGTAEAHVKEEGKVGAKKAGLMLVKSLVGSGILFLGHAFLNGGLAFSIVAMVVMALVSLWSYILLGQAHSMHPVSYADIGGLTYGPGLRLAILSSITASQLGLMSAYSIFVAQNLQAFVAAVTKCATVLPITGLIYAQLVVLLPLAMIRNIAKLSLTALIADAFILAGLVYIGYSEIVTIAHHGMAPNVRAFNPVDFPLMLGTAVFAFEGICLIIPIKDAMRRPEDFSKVVTYVVLGLLVVMTILGALGYSAYGENVQTVILLNLPPDDIKGSIIQLFYSAAIVLSAPLQLFPAVRIMENGLFTRSGKFSQLVKWRKNLFRALVLLCTSFLAQIAAGDLDKFVSLLGAACLIPLSFIYPPLIHYRACASTPWQRRGDVALFIFGVIMTVFTTTQTLASIAADDSGSPKFGNCPQPQMVPVS